MKRRAAIWISSIRRRARAWSDGGTRRADAQEQEVAQHAAQPERDHDGRPRTRAAEPLGDAPHHRLRRRLGNAQLLVDHLAAEGEEQLGKLALDLSGQLDPRRQQGEVGLFEGAGDALQSARPFAVGRRATFPQACLEAFRARLLP
jgi:hypothetical protein